MKLVAVLNGRTIPIEIKRENGLFNLTIEEKSFSVDAICPSPKNFSLIIEGKSYEAALEKKGSRYSIYFFNDTIEFDLYEARKFRASELTKKSAHAGPFKIAAPMPGKIVKIAVAQDSQVNEGDPLLIMEAMKMQNELKAPRAGKISDIQVREGEAVASQQTLLILE